jgi:hypothetical protein
MTLTSTPKAIVGAVFLDTVSEKGVRLSLVHLLFHNKFD